MRFCIQLFFIISCTPFISAYFGLGYLACSITECCRDALAKDGVQSLKIDLKNKLFGQHFVFDRLIPALSAHFQEHPQKPFVLSMSGWTGQGKNYVTEMMIKSLYKLGIKSKFIHTFEARIHFPFQYQTNQYKADLQEKIRASVQACSRSMFIFHEIDHMPSGIIDAIKPFLDAKTAVDGVDYREAIFVFTSNVGGKEIFEKYMELWNEGFTRENMPFHEFEQVLRKSLYVKEGGFFACKAVEHFLISMYLPFLPLEKIHIKLCVEAEAQRQRYYVDDEIIDGILEELEYDSEYDRFSTSGCKRISELVSVYKYARRRKSEF